VRRYYLFRNTLALVGEYFRIYPHWAIYHGLALAQILLGVLLLERRKAATLRACFLGVFDAIRGNFGPARFEI